MVRNTIASLFPCYLIALSSCTSHCKTNIIPHCSLSTLQLSWQNKHYTTLFSVYSLTLLAKQTSYHTVLCVLSNSPGKTNIIPHCSLSTLQLSWQNKHHTTLFSVYSPTLLAKQTSYHTVLCVLSNSPGKTNIIPHCSLSTLQLSWQNKHHTTLFSVYSLTLLAKQTSYHTVLCLLSNSPGKTNIIPHCSLCTL